MAFSAKTTLSKNQNLIQVRNLPKNFHTNLADAIVRVDVVVDDVVNQLVQHILHHMVKALEDDHMQTSNNGLTKDLGDNTVGDIGKVLNNGQKDVTRFVDADPVTAVERVVVTTMHWLDVGATRTHAKMGVARTCHVVAPTRLGYHCVAPRALLVDIPGDC